MSWTKLMPVIPRPNRFWWSSQMDLTKMSWNWRRNQSCSVSLVRKLKKMYLRVGIRSPSYDSVAYNTGAFCLCVCPAGVSALLTVALEGARDPGQLQMVEFGRGFGYKLPLSIGMPSIGGNILKQIVRMSAITVCRLSMFFSLSIWHKNKKKLWKPCSSFSLLVIATKHPLL